MDKLDKVIKRIKVSKCFFKDTKYNDYGKRYSSYIFDDELVVDAYNGILRVVFNGEIVGHYYGTKGVGARKVDDGKDDLYDAIHRREKEKTNSIMAML